MATILDWLDALPAKGWFWSLCLSGFGFVFHLWRVRRHESILEKNEGLAYEGAPRAYVRYALTYLMGIEFTLMLIFAVLVFIAFLLWTRLPISH